MIWDCDRITDLMPDYVAGDLSPADRTAFEAHLAACNACKAEEAEWSGMKSSLHGFLDDQLGSLDLNAVQERVMAEIPSRPEAPSNGSVHRFPAWVGAAAVIFLAVFLGVLGVINGPDDPYPQPKPDAKRVDAMLDAWEQMDAEDERIDAMLEFTESLEADEDRVDSMLDFWEEMD